MYVCIYIQQYEYLLTCVYIYSHIQKCKYLYTCVYEYTETLSL